METLNRVEKEWIGAAEILAKSYSEYYSQKFSSSEHQKFILLKLQWAIIQFEICSDMLNVLRTKKSTFGRKVALKSIIHKIFEFRKSLTATHINTIQDLAVSKNLEQEKNKLAEISKNYRTIINKIQQYNELRKVATAHYDPDISKQIKAIESIDENEAIDLIGAFLLFKKDITSIMRQIGKS
jgi:hypothetical protein